MFPTVRLSPILHSYCSLAELVLLVGASHTCASEWRPASSWSSSCTPVLLLGMPRSCQDGRRYGLGQSCSKSRWQSQDPAAGTGVATGRLLLLPQCVPVPSQPGHCLAAAIDGASLPLINLLPCASGLSCSQQGVTLSPLSFPAFPDRLGDAVPQLLHILHASGRSLQTPTGSLSPPQAHLEAAALHRGDGSSGSSM